MSDSPLAPHNYALHQATLHLLNELFNGTPESGGFMLNPGDPGMLEQLGRVSADVASTRNVEGLTTIAAHVDHVLYGISLLNRWANGEPEPWNDADWSQSWKRTNVTEDQWDDLRSRLRNGVEEWMGYVQERTEWDHLAACGTIASLAHSAYHLGAIRQILATQGMKPIA